MNGETQDTPERGSRHTMSEWLCWLGVIVLLYVLSTGPLMMMVDKKIIRPGGAAGDTLEIVYSPMRWACEKSPLRRPIGIYLHLWVPERYDSKGNSKRK